MYVIIVLEPMVLNFEISFRSEIPLISDAKIKGIAINFKSLTKIVPSGLIQLLTNKSPPLIFSIKTPNKTPDTIPIKIFQCKAIFFMFIIYLI